MSSSWRTARGVSPSPQVFSRGNRLLLDDEHPMPRLREPVRRRRPGRPAHRPRATSHVIAARPRPSSFAAPTGRRAAAEPDESTLPTSVVGNAYTTTRSRRSPATRPRAASGRTPGNAQPAARLDPTLPFDLGEINRARRRAPHLVDALPHHRRRVRGRADQAAAAEAAVPDEGRVRTVRDDHRGRDCCSAGSSRRSSARSSGHVRRTRRPRLLMVLSRKPRDPAERRPGPRLRRRDGLVRAVRARVRDRPARVADVRERVARMGRQHEVHLPERRADPLLPVELAVQHRLPGVARHRRHDDLRRRPRPEPQAVRDVAEPPRGRSPKPSGEDRARAPVALRPSAAPHAAPTATAGAAAEGA